ncbi:uncharacterized protein K02A2.6-like [Aedes albopictus]|uniref:Reverse transcriptase domain-containing protein n=1 Tax=Aedes albopictus TaxID=7160 RepID=A0ABM1Y2M5_AEDAL
MRQKKDERFAQFVFRLRQQVAECGFEKYSSDIAKVLTEITLIDVIAQGCTSNELRSRILKEDQTLPQIEALGAMIESVEEQVRGLSSFSTSEEKIYRIEERKADGSNVQTSGGKINHIVRSSTGNHNPNVRDRVACFSCGRHGHFSNSPHCPARNQECRNCKMRGHFETVCRKGKKRGAFNQSGQKESKKIRLVESTETNSEMQAAEKTYYAFYSGNKANMIACCIGGVSCDMLVDSGADCNLVTPEAWNKFKEAGIKVYSSTKGCDRKLKAYGSENLLNVSGSFVADIRVGQKCVKAEFFVVTGGQQCLLGDETSKLLGILKVGLDVNKVTEEVKPFSKISGVQVKIHTDPEIKPVFQPLRRVPIPLESAVKSKLEQLLARDIIEVKTGPTSWVSPLVVVGKANGDVRLCLDLRRVNEAVLRERHPMPVVDEYLARLGKDMIRSKLDIREAFLQVELDPESRDVTTFITSLGLFRFKRLPFGLVTAPEAFQRTMDEILTGCEGTHWYLDDVIIEGSTEEEHDRRVDKVV